MDIFPKKHLDICDFISQDFLYLGAELEEEEMQNELEKLKK